VEPQKNSPGQRHPDQKRQSIAGNPGPLASVRLPFRSVSARFGLAGAEWRYEGLEAFRQGREAIERELASAPEDIRRSIRWLPIGEAVQIPLPGGEERIAPPPGGAAGS
jgi:hypothetical protein